MTAISLSGLADMMQMSGQMREAVRAEACRSDAMPRPVRWHSVSCACDDCLDADYFICVPLAGMAGWGTVMG
jgi:hypothetical protein